MLLILPSVAVVGLQSPIDYANDDNITSCGLRSKPSKNVLLFETKHRTNYGY